MLAQNRVLDKDRGRYGVCILLFSWNISKPSRPALGGPEMGSGGLWGYCTVTFSSGMKNASKKRNVRECFKEEKHQVSDIALTNK